MSIATLTTEITKANLKAGRLHILPDGRFRSTDTRPARPKEGWLITDDIAARLKAKRGQRKNRQLIDYEHQSILSASNGKPAPAAGWSTGLDYTPGKGIYLTDINWTDRARAHLKAGEYKYASAVFSYDPSSGAVTEVISAALTNTPGIDGLQQAALTACLSAEQPNTHLTGATMNEHLTALLAALKLDPATASEQDCKAIQSASASAATATAALDKLTGEHNAALKQIAALNSEIVSLKTAQAEAAKTAAAKEQAELIAAAMSGDTPRLTPAMKDWAESLQLGALKTYLEHARVLTGITGQQGKRGATDAGAALTAEDKEVADKMGIDHITFAAAKSGQPQPVSTSRE